MSTRTTYTVIQPARNFCGPLVVGNSFSGYRRRANGDATKPFELTETFERGEYVIRGFTDIHPLDSRDRPMKSEPRLGRKVNLDFRSEFGGVSPVVFYDTLDALALADGVHEQRDQFDCLYVHAPDGFEGSRTVTGPLVFGSEIDVTAVVADLPPAEVQARVEKALAAEFGDLLGKNHRVRTRPVKDERFDVYDKDDRLVAINVLGVETSLFHADHGPISTRPTSADAPSVVVGS